MNNNKYTHITQMDLLDLKESCFFSSKKTKRYLH